MKKTILVILHFVLTILSWTSWLWLSWELIAVASLLHIALLEMCDGCFLSHAQFGDKRSENTAFYEWWLGKLGVKNYDRKKLRIFMRYCVPVILVGLGVLAQKVFGLAPLVRVDLFA